MIKGHSKKRHTPNSILQHISEYDVYRHYLGHDFTLNRATHSPFREDKSPSLLIGSKFGRLYHIDFGDVRYRGSCFDFVMQRFNVNLPACLEIIAHDFGLEGGGIPQTGIPAYVQPKAVEPIDTIIQVKSTPFTKEHLGYWNKYYIGEDELKRENIYAIGRLYINKKRIALPKDEIAFGYLYKNRYWKIYRPMAKNKSDKWRNNTPIDTVDGLENIRDCKVSVVTKSKKDKIVLLKIFPCICSVQNESVVALNKDTVSHLREHGGEVYINYDADAPGKRSSWSVTKQFGFRHINVPDKYLKEGIKDFADLARYKGLQVVYDHFKEKGIV